MLALGIEAFYGQELDGHRLPEREVLSREHHPHASAADEPIDAVLARDDVPRSRVRRLFVGFSYGAT
jgi:hypothetical protein